MFNYKNRIINYKKYMNKLIISMATLISFFVFNKHLLITNSIIFSSAIISFSNPSQVLADTSSKKLKKMDKFILDATKKMTSKDYESAIELFTNAINIEFTYEELSKNVFATKSMSYWGRTIAKGSSGDNEGACLDLIEAIFFSPYSKKFQDAFKETCPYNLLLDKAFEIVHKNDPEIVRKYPKSMFALYKDIMEKLRKDRMDNPEMDKAMKEKNIFPLTSPDLVD